jgi:hypothetical protein
MRTAQIEELGVREPPIMADIGLFARLRPTSWGQISSGRFARDRSLGSRTQVVELNKIDTPQQSVVICFYLR